MLGEQIHHSQRSQYIGGFAIDGRTTPTATRLEGLIAVLSFLPPDHEIWVRAHDAVDGGMSFPLRAHMREGEFAGAIPRTVGLINGDTPYAQKFNRRATEVRIDYVQHALSAMIQYLNLTEDATVPREPGGVAANM